MSAVRVPRRFFVWQFLGCRGCRGPLALALFAEAVFPSFGTVRFKEEEIRHTMAHHGLNMGVSENRLNP